jgi:hypothetical protein
VKLNLQLVQIGIDCNMCGRPLGQPSLARVINTSGRSGGHELRAIIEDMLDREPHGTVFVSRADPPNRCAQCKRPFEASTQKSEGERGS